MFSNKTVVTSIVAATMLMPFSAFAASSWSAVTVSQSQSGNISTYGDAVQTADITTSTTVDGQAAASSHVVGNQSSWFTGRFNQSQDLTSASSVEWEKGKWPAYASANSVGTVDQSQDIRGKRVGKEEQTAGVWLDSNVGSDKSHVVAGVGQNITTAAGSGYGYGQQSASQDQSIGAATHSEGYINPPHPSSWGCSNSCGGWGSSWSGQLRQSVTVMIENILNF